MTKATTEVERLREGAEDRRNAPPTARKKKQPATRRQTPVVALRRVRCPLCSSTNVKTTRTLESDFEIVSRRQSCRQCGLAFITIFD
jgi:hypothetical protein